MRLMYIYAGLMVDGERITVIMCKLKYFMQFISVINNLELNC